MGTVGSEDKLCLRWNDFESHFSNAFSEMRNEADFFDVRLACSESVANMNQVVRAHKVVLSACSPVFKGLLKALENTGSNNIIFLRGIRHRDLEALMDFMYYGEVNIEQSELDTFLGAAEELRIKGLTPNDNKNNKSNNSIQSKIPSSSSSSGIKRKAPPQPSSSATNTAPKVPRSQDNDVPKVEDFVPIKSESGAADDSTAFEVDADGDGSYVDYGEGLDESSFDQTDYDDGAGPSGNQKDFLGGLTAKERRKQLHQLISRDEETGQLFCSLCEMPGCNRTILVRHIEAKHVKENAYPCAYCEKSFKNSNHRSVHVHQKHREENKLNKNANS